MWQTSARQKGCNAWIEGKEVWKRGRGGGGGRLVSLEGGLLSPGVHTHSQQISSVMKVMAHSGPPTQRLVSTERERDQHERESEKKGKIE